MNRRNFLKAYGVGVVAPSLVALGGTTVIPEVYGTPVEDRVYGLTMPPGTLCYIDDNGTVFPMSSIFDDRVADCVVMNDGKCRFFTDSDDNLFYEFPNSSFRKPVSHA